MPTNFNPSQAECPSCSGCSLHENYRHSEFGVAAGIGTRDLQSSGSSNFLADPGSLADSGSLANPGAASDGPLRGVRFALASLGLFLVPILLAIAGAIWGGGDWGRGDPNGQFLGATSGLLVGMVGSMVVARVLRARSHEFKPLEIKSLGKSKGDTP